MASLEVLNRRRTKYETLEYTSETTTKQQIEKAHKAFKSWREVDAHERADKLYKWFSLINEHKDELAELITKEGGKPLKEAQGEVDYANSYVSWYAEEAKRIYGRTIRQIHLIKILLKKFPVGVVGAITLELSDRNDYA